MIIKKINVVYLILECKSEIPLDYRDIDLKYKQLWQKI